MELVWVGPQQTTSNADVGTSHCKTFANGIVHSTYVFSVLFSLSLLLLLWKFCLMIGVFIRVDF